MACFKTIIVAALCLTGASAQLGDVRWCAGKTITYTCNIPSPGHEWTIVSADGDNLTSGLVYRAARRLSMPPYRVWVREAVGAAITSVLSVRASPDLNNTVIKCKGLGIHSMKSRRLQS